MVLFAHECPKWEFCVMNGIAFRLSIVCYDRLFSRKCARLSIQAIRLFFKISGGWGVVVILFPPPNIFYVPSSTGRLSYYWKSWDARIGQEPLHIGSFFTFLSYFTMLWPKKRRELLSLDTGQLDVAAQSETCSSRYPVRIWVRWAEI